MAIKAFSLDLTPEQARDFSTDLGTLPGQALTHPSIIAPLAAGMEGPTPYLVEDYFVAESADVALKQYGPAPIPDALRLVGQLAGAFDFASAAGVHHGALHPRDILVAPQDVRLSGLGIVGALERVGYRPAVRRPYAAPERASGMPVSAAADVFSLACVAFELLTGRRPSLSGDAVVADTSSVASADASALFETFARALSVRPEDRHASALGFAAAFKHALTGEPLQSAIEPERPRTRRGPRPARRTPLGTPGESPPASEATDERGSAPGSLESGGAVLLPSEPAPSAPRRPGRTPRAVAPAPTPLPSFLEQYGDEPPASEPVAPPPSVEEIPPPSPALDFADLPLPVDATIGIGPTEAPLEPAADAVVSADPPPPEQDSRIEPTIAIPVRPRPAVPARSRDAVAEPSQPVQEALVLDRTEPVPPVDERPLRDVPPAEEPPADGRTLGLPARTESHAGGRLVPMLGMLLIGVLLGFPAGYLAAPKPGGESARKPADSPASAPASQAQAVPAQSPAPTATPAPVPLSGGAAPGASAGGPAAAAAPRAPVGAPSSPAASAPRSVAGGGGAAPRLAKSEPKATPQRERHAAKPKAPAEAAPATAGQAVPRASAAAAASSSSPAVFEGGLSVASKPVGATVYLDSHPVGTTPMTLQSVSAGSHAVRLELTGYNSWTSAVQVTAGKQNRVTASLERRPGG